MSTKTPECWTSDSRARALRVEISADRSLLLPFDQFVFAEMRQEGKKQQFRLVFATHEVLVRGYALRRIETTLQRMELASISIVTGDLSHLISEGQPIVSEISLIDMNPMKQQ